MTHNRRILVVEDDVTIKQAIAYLLKLEGYEVELASNGQDALEKLQDGYSPCLIILDLMMPVMDGMEFMRKFQADSSIPHPPVVVLSGDGRVKEKTESLAVVESILKPVSIEKILDIAQRYC
jgi:CheY-like chemotaxis protein